MSRDIGNFNNIISGQILRVVIKSYILLEIRQFFFKIMWDRYKLIIQFVVEKILGSFLKWSFFVEVNIVFIFIFVFRVLIFMLFKNFYFKVSILFNEYIGDILLRLRGQGVSVVNMELEERSVFRVERKQ